MRADHCKDWTQEREQSHGTQSISLGLKSSSQSWVDELPRLSAAR